MVSQANSKVKALYKFIFTETAYVKLIQKEQNLRLYELPFGWKKKCIKRVGGKSAGKWDVTLITPDQKYLRSLVERDRYLEQFPYVKCDASVTETQWFTVCPTCNEGNN